MMMMMVMMMMMIMMMMMRRRRITADMEVKADANRQDERQVPVPAFKASHPNTSCNNSIAHFEVHHATHFHQMSQKGSCSAS